MHPVCFDLYVCCTGKMCVHIVLYVSLVYGLLIVVIAELEHIQHAGHVHTAHEVDGKHNVEFDHEAILGVLCMRCFSNYCREYTVSKQEAQL